MKTENTLVVSQRTMGTFIDKILGLKDPQLVANFQKLCQIEILSENKNSQQETDSSRKTIENDELHKRLVHTNGVIQGSKNGLISNGNACQNDTVVSNGVHDHNTENSNCDNKEVKDLKCRNKAKYIVHNKFLFWMFRCGAELGNEFFYLTFFTFCLWNLNSLVTRQMAIIWHAGMYLGQAVKDIICWERPSSPPCARLELRYEEEYGMPSTHATVGVIIPFGLLLIAHRHYEVNSPLLATLLSRVVSLSVRFPIGNELFFLGHSKRMIKIYFHMQLISST